MNKKEKDISKTKKITKATLDKSKKENNEIENSINAIIELIKKESKKRKNKTFSQEEIQELLDKKKVFIDEDSADTIFNKLFDLKFLNNDVDFGDDDDISETDFFDTINKKSKTNKNKQEEFDNEDLKNFDEDEDFDESKMQDFDEENDDKEIDIDEEFDDSSRKLNEIDEADEDLETSETDDYVNKWKQMKMMILMLMHY